ncbi:hypothetical protein [Paraoerskovia sediminicola]|uniref:hypothetical protein n=1 Tax=Paraoerskovia sediminicola TaxID=1138587 RepID=UPI0025737D70|nr:hypothetical protein [Paraoerskovia sediminicola]
MPTSPMPPYGPWLRALPADRLVTLLDRRPDLAVPAPSTLRSLGARATSRNSIEIAVSRLDTAAIEALEAVLVLGGSAASSPGTTIDDVVRAVLGDTRHDDAVAALTRALAELTAACLVWGGSDDVPVRGDVPGAELSPDLGDGRLRAAPGVDEVLGPHPAGLAREPEPMAGAGAGDGVEARSRAGAKTGTGTQTRRAGTTHAADATSATAGPTDTADPTDPAELVAGALADAPPGAREILGALTWGPPVGVAPRSGAGAEATRWLLAKGLLERADGRYVVLPRDVALALRDGRTHRDPHPLPRSRVGARFPSRPSRPRPRPRPSRSCDWWRASSSRGARTRRACCAAADWGCGSCDGRRRTSARTPRRPPSSPSSRSSPVSSATTATTLRTSPRRPSRTSGSSSGSASSGPRSPPRGP